MTVTTLTSRTLSSDRELEASRTHLDDLRRYRQRLEGIVSGLRQAHVDVPQPLHTSLDISARLTRLIDETTRQASEHRRAVTTAGGAQIVQQLARSEKADLAEVGAFLLDTDRDARQHELLADALRAAIPDIVDADGHSAHPREVLIDQADDIHHRLDACLQDLITKARGAIDDLGGYLPQPQEAIDLGGAEELETYRTFTRDLASQYGKLRDVQRTLDAFLYDVSGATERSAAELSIVYARNIDTISPGWAGPTWLDSSGGNAVVMPHPWTDGDNLSQLTYFATHRDSKPWIPTLAERSQALAEQLAHRDERHETAKQQALRAGNHIRY